MLEYNEITQKKYIVVEDTPYEVLSSHVFRKQKRKPVNQTKLKNLMTGRVTEMSFHQSDKAEEADIESQKIKYLYKAKGEFFFCEEENPSNRFSLKEELIGSQSKFMRGDMIIDALMFDEEVIGVKIPVKMDLKVTEAPPAVRGNTSQGATKQIVLETGAVINAPIFIKEGDVVRVNTETEEYTERV